MLTYIFFRLKYNREIFGVGESIDVELESIDVEL